MGVIYEHGTDQPGPEKRDGMEDWVIEMEARGFEGEHVFDAMYEDPPHPWWKESMERQRAKKAREAEGKKMED